MHRRVTMLDSQDGLDVELGPGLEPLFELGGPAYRLMQRIGVIKGAGPSIARRSVAFIAITWLPMLLFATLEGYAIGPTPRSSLLLDFATYARLFIAVPLIFAAESVVGPRIRAAGLRFVEAGLVRQADYPAFLAAAASARRRRDAALPEVLFILIALVGASFLTVEQLGGLSTMTWHTVWTNGGPRLMPAGIWYTFVAIPLVQFFLLRWLWRLAIWTLFLRDMSRLQLNLMATDSDEAAGLSFLGAAHVSLSIFPFAMSCVIAAEIAFRVQFEGMDLTTLRTMLPLLITYLIFVEAVTFGPLTILVPMLARLRREAKRSYGLLVQHHNQLFHDKWIAGNRPADELPLGSTDMSSLIDLGSSVAIVRQMTLLPVARRQLVQVALIACLPGLPLALLVLPFAEVLKLLMGVIV
jgi:hypothetical protein